MIRIMKAIIVKEIRENLRWAGLIFLITPGLLAFGLYDQFSMGMSILGRTFLILCMLMYPAAGLALGLVQGFQDSRKGRWQFITHRPVSPSQLLAGKVLVGIALYFAATLIPLAVAIFWVATPGHVSGPFTWDMTEPALAYLLSGLMWYAAGLLIAMRTARWIGSRIIPVGGAIVGAFAIQLCAMTLLISIAITIVCTAWLLIAAWGVLIAGGETSRSPGWTKPLTGLTLLIGWIFVIALGMALGKGAVEMFPAPRDFSYQLYQLTRNGDVRIWSYSHGRVEKIQDMSGHDLPITSDDLLYHTDLSAAKLFIPEDYIFEGSSIFRASSEGFLNPKAHMLYSNSQSNWFYLVSRRTIQGYEPQTHQYLGSLGPNGFTGSNGTPQAFPEPLQTDEFRSYFDGLLAFPDAVYDLDIAVRRVSRIYTSAAGDPVIGATSFSMNSHPSELSPAEPDYLVVATRKYLHIVQRNRSLMMAPIEETYLRGYPFATVGRTTSGQFVVAYGDGYGVGNIPGVVSEYSPDGTLIRRTDLPVTPHPTESDVDGLGEEISLLTIFPPAFSGTALGVHRHRGRTVPSEAIAILSIASIGYAVIVFAMLRARHATRRQFYLWIPLAAALGLSGVLLLVSMLDKVNSVRCPSCGKRRLLTESECPHCNTVAPSPPMLGIEIFESAMTAS